jgi:hypothetical protein
LRSGCRRRLEPCGDPFNTAVDASAGSFSYVEDCQGYSQPIELKRQTNDQGVFVDVIAGRAD